MQILKDISKPTQSVLMMTARQYLFWRHFSVRMEESTLLLPQMISDPITMALSSLFPTLTFLGDPADFLCSNKGDAQLYRTWEKNKSLLWSLTLRKRYKKKPIIGLITGFFGGGDGGIRTHDPQGASWFRVMSVMTTSIRLRILVIYLVYCTCFLCDCQVKLHKFVNFKFNP